MLTFWNFKIVFVYIILLNNILNHLFQVAVKT